ncbi:MAG: DUF2283 domain-containing protein [Rhodanobacter sp.]|nr:DUF2283 domain-containing protein [Rhodanobacter sp.]
METSGPNSGKEATRTRCLITTSLYIHLSEHPGAYAKGVTDGVVLDFAVNGALVGIDTQHASRVADLSRFLMEHVPLAA